MESGFTYVYKTSDGKRHTEEMSAASREEVFEELRRRGIKAIKVVANDGSRANGAESEKGRASTQTETGGIGKRRTSGVLVAAAALIVSAIVVGTWHFFRIGEPGRSQEYERLAEAASTIQGDMDSRIAALDIDLLQNYALIENTPDASSFYTTIERANDEVEKAKASLRDTFKDVESTFHDPAELGLAQKLYGDTVEAIEAAGQAIAFRGYAFMLLDENRGKWKTVRDGERRRIEWTDPALEQKFNFYTKGGVSSATMRWKRDFAPAR